MAALTNTILAENVVESLDREFINNFNGEISRLTEVLGIFGPEVVPAGTAMYQYTVTGQLNSTTVAEGDEVPLSEYDVDKDPIGEHTIKPYRKLTTAQAILKAGYENAIIKTDEKMVKDIRAAILSQFFTFLATGTGSATGAGLQATLAQVDAKLQDTMETNGDSTDRIIHFVNPYDIADYLANAQITTQTAFGMTYLQDFLGVQNIFVTNKVAANTVYATPAENIHIYGVDFSTLGNAALSYTVSDGGLVGVHHTPNYERTSSETYALVGCDLLAEIKNYIVKGTITDPTA